MAAIKYLYINFFQFYLVMKGQGKEMEQEPSAAKGQINKFNKRKPTPAALPSNGSYNGIDHQAHMSEKDINVSRNL